MSLPGVYNAASLARTDWQSRYLALVFSCTIFLSAFLLFGVQPMFTKMVLPWLGGSPGVWSVAMVFFQGLLLLGYLYAHLSTTFLKPGTAVVLHGLLAFAAFLTLPLTVSEAFGAPPETGQGFWLLIVFAASVGLPFFVLSATAPLLQAWFSRTVDRRADNPYFLYIASNTGSFAALIAYPLLIEPLASLHSQRLGWTGMFAMAGVALLACGFIANARPKATRPADGAVSAPRVAITWKQRAIWTGLASVPSGLIVAVTAHISTDIASAPLLWVVPLALFMLTFILAFQERMFISDAALTRIFVCILPFVVVSVAGFNFPLWFQFIIHLGILFMAAMVCHRRLYLTRPAATQLTEFYLWMSFGGMLGGLFAGLLAPLLFDTILEYRLLLIAALLCVPAAATAPRPLQQWVFLALCVLASIGLITLTPALESLGKHVPVLMGYATTLAFLVIICLNRSGPIASAGAACAAFLAFSVVVGLKQDIAVRSFYGVNYVRLSNDGAFRLLRHGSTLHGAVRIKDMDGNPITGRPQSTTYYHDKGAINVALMAARKNAGGTLGNVAVLGLGSGAMACQSKPGEKWVFFEIDQEVAKLARRPALFPFLHACTPEARVIIGDARLTLQKETENFDVIILDAFSSDTVPAHLLTKEAFAIYKTFLAADGMIIAHVSNRYMDIRTVAEAGAQANGLASASRHIPVDANAPDAKFQFATPTVAVAISRSQAALNDLIKEGKWSEPPPDTRKSLWSDDYANIVGAIIREKTNPARD
jgi:spermidine synthase